MVRLMLPWAAKGLPLMYLPQSWADRKKETTGLYLGILILADKTKHWEDTNSPHLQSSACRQKLWTCPGAKCSPVASVDQFYIPPNTTCHCWLRLGVYLNNRQTTVVWDLAPSLCSTSLWDVIQHCGIGGYWTRHLCPLQPQKEACDYSFQTLLQFILNNTSSEDLRHI